MECIISIFILLHNSADQLINASISDLFNIPDTVIQNFKTNFKILLYDVLLFKFIVKMFLIYMYLYVNFN